MNGVEHIVECCPKAAVVVRVEISEEYIYRGCIFSASLWE